MAFTFNELSSNCIKSVSDIDNLYKKIRRYQELTKLEAFPSVIFNESFASETYNGLGTIYDILKDSSLDRDEQDHLKSLIQNAPFSMTIINSNIDVKFNNETVQGFQYSAIHNIRSISIPSDLWDKYSYSVNKDEFNPTTEKINSEIINIEHLGDLNKYQGEWLEGLIPLTTYTNVNEFIERIPQLYPHVILSENARQGLTGFNLGKLNSLERAMKIFNVFCQKHWKGKFFRKNLISELGVKIKDESDRTMEKYGHQRNFRNENGKKEIIPLHFNISQDYRGNIKATEDKKIYIAYLGHHLSTVTDK